MTFWRTLWRSFWHTFGYILAHILDLYSGGQFPDAKWLCMGRVIDFGAHLIHTYHYTWLGRCVLSNKHNWNWWYRSTSGSMTGHPNWDPGSNTIVCTCFAKKKHTHLFLFRFSIRVGCSGGGGCTNMMTRCRFLHLLYNAPISLPRIA